MSKFILFSILVFAVTGRADRQWFGSDFFVERGGKSAIRGKPAIAPAPGACRARISKVVCVVDPVKAGEESKERVCAPDSLNYAHFFEELHDAYPPALQRMFCSLQHIFVEKQFGGTAYAGIVHPPEATPVAVMGIRKSVLDEGLDLQTWATWKEELSFGGETGSYAPTKGLPSIQTGNQAANVSDFLYFVVAHEFGHIFDFANELNKTKDPACDSDKSECEVHPESWGALSWVSNKRPLPQNEFAHREGLCFYWCGKNPLPKTAVLPLYHGLAITNFISTYATTQPWDDFADSLAYYLSEKNLGMFYQIDTEQGKRYWIDKKLRSRLFGSKYEYIENFLARTDIAYP